MLPNCRRLVLRPCRWRWSCSQAWLVPPGRRPRTRLLSPSIRLWRFSAFPAPERSLLKTVDKSLLIRALIQSCWINRERWHNDAGKTEVHKVIKTRRFQLALGAALALVLAGQAHAQTTINALFMAQAGYSETDVRAMTDAYLKM